jgi:hypothetical protein
VEVLDTGKGIKHSFLRKFLVISRVSVLFGQMVAKITAPALLKRVNFGLGDHLENILAWEKNIKQWDHRRSYSHKKY